MSDQAFPPADPASFLALCAGEWMSLRSSFALSNGDDDWHTSERGELTVRFESGGGELLGRLLVEPPGGNGRSLSFVDGGELIVDEQSRGEWHFWPDGSVELHLPQPDGSLVQERIWFTRANLRLRSTTAVDAGGNPLEGSFCTDIRRVSKPAA